MAAAMSELWNQQVVVENRSGAGNTLAPAYVAKAAPDGYTLHRCGVGDSIAPALYKNLPYSHLRDFSILARIGLTPNILVIHPSIPARNLTEFIALARAQPGKLDYGTTGMGSSPQLSFELFKSMTRTDITFVPRCGSADWSSARRSVRPSARSVRARRLVGTTPPRPRARAPLLERGGEI